MLSSQSPFALALIQLQPPLLQVHLPFGQINCCQMQEIDGILDLAVWLPLLHFHFIHLPLLF